jgi:hypothetical protein
MLLSQSDMNQNVFAEDLNRLAVDESSRNHPGRVAAAAEVLRQYSQAFVAAGEHQGTRTGLTSEARLLLLNFAWDSAEQAVEKKSPELVARWASRTRDRGRQYRHPGQHS